MVFTTLYACQFCDVVHRTKDSISQHQDSHLAEFRGSRPVPTLEQQELHPKEIIRAVRSLRKRGKRGEPRTLPIPVEGVELRDECSGWTLVITLSSWAQHRAHLALDRTELTCDFWTRFVDAGLQLNGGSDPRVGTGWLELQEAENQRQRYLAIAARRRLEQENARQAVELDQQRLEAQALWDDADWEEYHGNGDAAEEADEHGEADEDDAGQDGVQDAAIDEARSVVHDQPIDLEAEHPNNELDRMLERVANVEGNLAAVNNNTQPASPKLHDASPIRATKHHHTALNGVSKGKAIAAPANTPPPGYGLSPLPNHLACDPESFYRDAPSASSSAQTDNIISGTHCHDNGGSSLAGNHGPISINQAASILTTRDNTIIAPVTPRRSRKRVAQSPLANPRVSDPTPRPGTSAVDITLRLLDTGTTLAVRGRDALDAVIAELKATMPDDVREAFVGFHGSGPAPAWAEMEDAEWGVQWNQRVWERVKRRGGAQVPLQRICVNGEWRFE